MIECWGRRCCTYQRAHNSQDPRIAHPHTGPDGANGEFYVHCGLPFGLFCHNFGSWFCSCILRWNDGKEYSSKAETIPYDITIPNSASILWCLAD
jgi:hypothetical protein